MSAYPRKNLAPLPPMRLLLFCVVAVRPVGLLADQPRSICLDGDLAVEQYDYRTWTSDDGLPSDQVLDIVQTRDGYLWLATERGLARFDGVRFTSFNRSNTPQLATNRVTTLHEGRDGTLWVATYGGGLVQCLPQHPPRFRLIEQLQGSGIRCLFEDTGGTLWIGTEAETWTLLDGKCRRRPDAPLNVSDICEDNSGTLWLGASQWMVSRPESFMKSDVAPQPGLYRFDDDRFHRLGEAEGFPQTEGESSVTTLCPDRTGGLSIGTVGDGLLRFKDGRCEDYAAAIGLKMNHFDHVHHDRAGHVWVSARTGGLQRLADGKPARLPTAASPANVRCIAEDREGNVWVGGGRRGLRQIRNPEIVRVKFDIGGFSVRCLLEDSAGDLWFGSRSISARNRTRSGLHRLTDGDFQHWGTDHGLPTHLVTGLAKGADGSLWIGTHQGLVQRQGGDFKVLTTVDGLGRNWIRAVHVARDGAVWVGFWEGALQRIHEGTFTMVPEFGDADVNWFHEDSSGALWIGSNRGLWKWRESKLERVRNAELDQLTAISFTACLEDRDGHLWLGTSGGGLCRWANGRISNWTSQHGLHDDVIHMIQEDTRGRLWLGGPHGLTSLEKTALDEIESGAIGRLEPRVYHGGSRTGPLRFGADYRPNAALRGDGSLWLASSAGAVVVPADGPYQNPVPPIVHVQEVRLDGKSTGTQANIETLSGPSRVEFRFTANTFYSPEMVRFRYQFVGHDDQWIDGGRERSVSYTDLPPGNYTFRVVADNGHGVWSESGDTIELTVKPRFWETWWFRGGAAVSMLVMTVLYFRFRVRHIRTRNVELQREIDDRQRAESALKQREEQLQTLSGRLIGAQEDERRRVARELHDDLSQRLAVLAIEVDSLVHDLGDDDENAVKTLHLKEEIVGVSRDVHALSHELHPSILDDLGLVDALEAKCHQMLQHDELDVDFQYHDVPSSLPKNIALCLYRVAQECLRNTVKHGQTDRASLSLLVEDQQIMLTISDTGVGFDVDQARGQGGLGLSSVEERTRLVGGELSIRSRSHQGTDVTVRIPLEV